jgi:hypothetical protein
MMAGKASIAPAPFAVVSPGTEPAFSALESQGFRAFYFAATGTATVNFSRGFIAHEFAHVPLTVWAVSALVASAAALRQLQEVAPGYTWKVSPAPVNEDRKRGRPANRA